MLSVAEVAERLNVAQATIYRMLQSGKLPGYKVGSIYRVDAAELEEFIAASRLNADGE